MAKHIQYVADEPRIYSELPFAFGEVHKGDVVETDQDSLPDHRWEKSSKTAFDKQKKAREQAAEPVTDGSDPLAQPDPEASPNA